MSIHDTAERHVHGADMVNGASDPTAPLIGEKVEPPEFEIAHKLTALRDGIINVGTSPLNVRVTVQYGHGQTVEVGDAAKAVAAPLPQLRPIGGSWHYDTHLETECLSMIVFCGVEEPPDAKLDRLRAELAELEAQIGDGS